MEYLNNFITPTKYVLMGEAYEGPIVYKGDKIRTMYGKELYFSTIEALNEEELYELFEGTPGNFKIQLQEGQNIIPFEKAKKDLKPEDTKVSFDFDGTLDKPDIQQYAIELVEKGYDVWIHTLRMDDKLFDHAREWNKDVYKIADLVGIPKENIVFCNMGDKWNFLKDKNFVWHIDDDHIECDMINRRIGCRGICHFGVSTWKNKCEKLLK